MNRYFLLLLSLLATGCCCMPQKPPLAPTPDNRAEVTWVVEGIMAKWRFMQHKRLHLQHAYVYFNGEYKGLRLEISSQEILEVREARDLLVDFTDDLLRAINEDESISSQLKLGSLQPSQLNIVINFESFYGRYLDPYYVGCIKLKQGMAYYYAFDLKQKGWYAWHSRVEPYEKTREISLIERAAAKAYGDEETYQDKIDASEGIFLPIDNYELRHPSPYRKF